ncbi:MAG: EcsC family protein [Myxococcaceae bacterium]
MSLFDPLLDQVKAVRRFSPANLKKLGNQRLSDLVEKEAVRARTRVDELIQRYPSAGPRELSQRLIDSKKNVASMVGGVTGVFGVVTVPVDLVGMLYLQLSLLTEVATVFKSSLKSDREKQELLDLLGYANGIGPFQRSTPKVLGSLAGVVLAKGGLKTLSRAMPLVAAPISAYLNNQHIQQVGDSAVRHYDGWQHAHEKSQRASGT